ncbi:MAG TPA: glycosyltransferase family 4 protein [Patescibacteria group bacterium]|nr:glycosyltransferase family 4 protein [Patescibacteria group bacterium]
MGKKPNVVIFKFSLALGGGEGFNFVIGKKLKELGYRLKFYSNYVPLLKQLRKEGIKCTKIYWGNEVGAKRYLPLYFLMLPINIIQFFFIFVINRKKDRKNIVVFQSLNEKIFATRVARLLGYKVFWIEHLSIRPWLVKSYFKKAYIKKSRYTNKIIVISKSVKDEIMEDLKIDPGKIEVIYNGVDLDRFKEFDLKIIENEKKKMGFYKESRIIGFDGRLHNEKGLDTLINSFYNLSRRFEYLYLMLAGDGPEKNRLEGLVRSLGIEKRVIFLGFKNKDEIPLFLNMLDVFVLPSKVRESFGIAIIEAMAVGKIVVASEIGGIPEIIERGVNGFLFTPGSEKELTDYLSKILSDKKLKQKIEGNALRRVKEKFSLDVMMKNLEGIFDK